VVKDHNLKQELVKEKVVKLLSLIVGLISLKGSVVSYVRKCSGKNIVTIKMTGQVNHDTRGWCTACYRGRHEQCSKNRLLKRSKQPCSCYFCIPIMMIR